MLCLLSTSLFGPEGRWGDGNTEILDGDGNLLRKALAAVVFSDEERRKKLDQVMFQKIIERIDDEISLLRRKSGIDGILLDAPLLFEAGLDTRCDAVLVLSLIHIWLSIEMEKVLNSHMALENATGSSTGKPSINRA